MTKKLIILLASLVLVVPFLFYGCSGSDGSNGSTGANGQDGQPGPAGPGALAKESCAVCHGAGAEFAVDKVHGLNTANRNTLKAGTVTIDNITNVVLPAPTADNYVKARVDFTFKALDSNGHNITSQIDLTSTNTAGDNLTLATFSIAKLVPGADNNHSNEWNSFVLDPGATGSGPYRTIVADNTRGAVFTRTANTPATGTDTYSYTFGDNVLRGSDGYVDNVVYRVTVQASSFDVTLFTSDPVLQTNDRRAVANAFRDQVGSIAGAAVTFPVPAGYPTKNDVTTAACNQCHDPIGFHSQSARRETTYCVVCHNIRSETVGKPAGGGFDNVNLINMVHGIHSEKNIGELGNFTEITYPQKVQNCTTCHQGTDDFWKTRPSSYACGSCHGAAMFTTGGTHATRTNCVLCHEAVGGTKADTPPSTTVAHALDNNLTPGNVPPGQDNIAFVISTVTVDNTGAPTVSFRVTKNGTPIVFNKYTGTDNAFSKKTFVDNGLITGYTGSPSFLVAFAANQDGINPVADYNNLGNGKNQGQPATVSVAEIFLNDNNAGTIVSGPDNTTGNYSVKLSKQVSRNATTGVITTSSSALYPAGAYMRAVGLQGRVAQLIGGVAKRRYATSVVKEVTGETKVRRQVVDINSCLECHKILAIHGGNRVNNVQLCVMCHNPSLGTGGVVSFNLKDFLHGVHSASAVYSEALEAEKEVTYPGEPKHCTKCHIGTPATAPAVANSYKADLPDGVLLTTTSVMGAAPASTDNVISPTAAACGRCHNASTAIDHFRLQGGDVGATRAEAAVTAPVTIMAVDITP